jgi:hypothetical protein
MRSDARAWQASRKAMSASVASVMKHWKRSPSMSVKGELGAGMGVLTTADHPGARRPGRRVEQMGDFGALRPLALLALEAPVRQGLHELMGARCGVGPKKHPLATNGIRGRGPHRPLRQGNVRHGFRLGCPGLSPSGLPDRASQAILDPRNSAHNSGHSAHAPTAETHERTALGAYLLAKQALYH